MEEHAETNHINRLLISMGLPRQRGGAPIGGTAGSRPPVKNPRPTPSSTDQAKMHIAEITTTDLPLETMTILRNVQIPTTNIPVGLGETLEGGVDPKTSTSKGPG